MCIGYFACEECPIKRYGITQRYVLQLEIVAFLYFRCCRERETSRYVVAVVKLLDLRYLSGCSPAVLDEFAIVKVPLITVGGTRSVV